MNAFEPYFLVVFVFQPFQEELLKNHTYVITPFIRDVSCASRITQWPLKANVTNYLLSLKKKKKIRPFLN